MALLNFARFEPPSIRQARLRDSVRRLTGEVLQLTEFGITHEQRAQRERDVRAVRPTRPREPGIPSLFKDVFRQAGRVAAPGFDEAFLPENVGGLAPPIPRQLVSEEDQIASRYAELLEETRQNFPAGTPPGTTHESLAANRLNEELERELEGQRQKLITEARESRTPLPPGGSIAPIGGRGSLPLKALGQGLGQGLQFLEETPGVGGGFFRDPQTGKSAFEEGAEISRPIVQAAQPIVAEPFEQVEAAGVPVVSPVSGAVATAIQSQIVEDIATEVINPAALVLVAPIALSAASGLRGVAAAEALVSNLLATGMEPQLVRGTLRGLTLLGREGLAALPRIAKTVRATRVFQEAEVLVRAGEAGGGDLRPFIKAARDEGLVDPQAITRRAEELAEAQGGGPLRGGEELGGFPERFTGKGRRLQGGPPPEPDPPRLPTIREVEARSAKPPPEVRAELAGDVPRTAIPLEDFGTVQARWGERFQRNIVTKIEEMLNGHIPGIAKPTPESRAVRRAMVQADIYRGTQKARMRALVYEWAGRNARVLGLTGGGRAKSVQAAPGAIIPRGRKLFGLADDSLTQRLDHIVEHPEKYIINPEQRRALDELDNIFEMVLRAEQREGIDVSEIFGDYFARVLVKRPGNDPNGVKLAGRLGTRPGHAKTRFFGDIEEAWKLGYRYADPMSALFNRLEGGADAIANINAVRVVKSLGQRPSARIAEELKVAARAARDEFVAARKIASKRGASNADRLRFQEAEAALNNHKKALRVAANEAKDIQPKVFGRIVSPEVAAEFGRYIGDTQEGILDQVMQMARANMIWGDDSAGLVQFWTLFWRDNPTWWRAMGIGLFANLRDPWGFVARNADVISRGTSVGAVTPPTEFLLRSGGKFSRAFGKLPVVKQTQRMFEWTIFTGQTMRWKAMEQMAKNADDLMELAAANRAASGVALTPGLTRAQAGALGKTFFAGRFLLATVSVFKNALKGGAAGAEARKILGMAFGGAFATMVGGHMALNNGKLPNLTDPDKAGFFSMRVGDVWVQPYGPFHPFIVATFRTGRAIKDIAEGKKPNSRDLQAWPRFLEGKASLGVRINLQIMDALGIPLSQLRGEPFQRLKLATGEDWLRQIQEYLPIGPSEAVPGVKDIISGGLGRAATLGEILGGRTSVVTPFQELSEGFEKEFGREFNPQSSADWTLARQNPRTAPLVEAQSARSLERGTEGALRAEATEQSQAQIEQELELPRLAQDFKAGNLKLGDDLVAGYYELQTQMAGALLRSRIGVNGREPATDDDRILKQLSELNPNSDPYRDFATGNIDWDRFRADVEGLRSGLTPEVRKAYKEIVRGVDPDWRSVEPEVRKAIDLRRTLFDTARHVDVTAEQEKEAAKFRREVDKVRDRLAASGLEPGDATISQYLAVAEDEGIEPKVAYLAFALRPNSSSEVSLRDPAYTAKLLKLAEDLAPYFPDLYSARRILQALPPHLQEVVIEGG